MTDWSPLLLSARKHIAGTEAYAALQQWEQAGREAWLAMDACAQLLEWFQARERGGAQIPLDYDEWDAEQDGKYGRGCS